MSEERRIHVLDKVTASKIAAGEVIDRTSSVVRELLDNAIDAGATEISVYLTGGGIKEIKNHAESRTLSNYIALWRNL